MFEVHYLTPEEGRWVPAKEFAATEDEADIIVAELEHEGARNVHIVPVSIA